MDDQTLHWWAATTHTFEIGSLVVAAIAAVVLGVSTWLSKGYAEEIHKREVAAFVKYKVDAGVLIEEAKREGIETGKAAADALLRAAEFEKEAANARLETERLKAVVAWRTVPQEAATILERLLAESPGAVNVRFMDGDPEALYFAIAISKILQTAKWQVALGASKPSNAIVFGIALPDAKSTDGVALRKAFSAAGIQFSTVATSSGPALSVPVIPGAPMLMVGSRTPPRLP